MSARQRNSPVAIVSALIAMIPLAAALIAADSRALASPAQTHAQAPPAQKAPKGKAIVPAPLPEVPMPFRIGEKLDYRIAWSAFNSAATLEITVPERRQLYSWRTWHLQAVFHTLRPVRTLFAIDDQFDSYTDTSSLESRQFEMYLQELGKSETHVLHFVPRDQPVRTPGPAVVVLPGTRDPLGMLFALRGVDWQHTPEVRVPVCDGHDLYEARAHMEALDEPVQVDAGTFRASRIAIRVFQNDKEVASTHFTLWFANDAARTPVQVVAELPFGEIRVELTSPKSSQR
jgi:hypothetical protein